MGGVGGQMGGRYKRKEIYVCIEQKGWAWRQEGQLSKVTEAGNMKRTGGKS